MIAQYNRKKILLPITKLMMHEPEIQLMESQNHKGQFNDNSYYAAHRKLNIKKDGYIKGFISALKHYNLSVTARKIATNFNY